MQRPSSLWAEEEKFELSDCLPTCQHGLRDLSHAFNSLGRLPPRP